MAEGDSDCYCSMVRRRTYCTCEAQRMRCARTAPVANLAPRRGERPLMVVRHDGDQTLAILDHTVLRVARRRRLAAPAAAGGARRQRGTSGRGKAPTPCELRLSPL